MLKRLFLLLAAAAWLAGAPRPTPLRVRLERIIGQTPAISKAFLGVQVVSLEDGRVLYQRNADRLFVPASNTKLFTTALALTRLGPEYRFTTRVLASQATSPDGRLRGDLIIDGSGDPSISGRKYPYESMPPDSPPDYSLRPIEDLADQIAAGGLREITGDVVGDDRRYLWEPYPAGWSIGDQYWEYGAPVSALTINDNSFGLTISPGDQAGELARFSLMPPLEPFTIDNRVLTVEGGPRKIEIDRRGRQLTIWGSIPIGDRGQIELLAMSDPALYAAQALRDALLRRGIGIRGQAAARHRYYDEVSDPAQGSSSDIPSTPGIELARRFSPRLSELLQVTDKVSQNLHAEIMLREVGAIRRNVGSREAGLADLGDFLNEIGTDPDQYRFVDGSGLSRETLLAPAAVTKLLEFMAQSKQRDLWINLLPVAGVDGTLGTRFAGHPEAKHIHAKTGSLAHIRALSGYADTKENGMVAFSIMVNNFDVPSDEITAFMDRMSLALLQ